MISFEQNNLGDVTTDDGEVVHLTQQAYLAGSNAKPLYQAAGQDDAGVSPTHEYKRRAKKCAAFFIGYDYAAFAGLTRRTISAPCFCSTTAISY